MKKIFILMGVMVLLVMAMASAFSTNVSDYVMADFSDTFGNGTGRNTPTDGDLLTDGFWTKDSTWTSFSYDDDTDLMEGRNMSMNLSNGGSGQDHENYFNFSNELSNVTISISCIEDSFDNTANMIMMGLLNEERTNVVRMGVRTATAGTTYSYNLGVGWLDTGIDRVSTQINFTAEVYQDGTDSWIAFFINDTFVANDTTGDAIFLYEMLSITALDIECGNLMVWNGSRADVPQPTPPDPDVTPPIIKRSFNISTDNIKINDILNISANFTDAESNLLFGNISINFSTGTVFINYSITGTSIEISNATFMIDARDNILNVTIYATDENNNIAQNSTLLTIVNTAPSNVTIILPTENDYNNTSTNYPFNVTFAADADGDGITIYYYINALLNFTSAGNGTFNATDGFYILNVSLTDGIDFSPNATVNFTIDTTFPTLLVFNLTNNTIFGYVNTTMNITILDNNPFNLTYNFHNASDDMIYFDYNATEQSTITISIVKDLNLTQLASGNYTLDINFSDKHTLTSIKDYDVRIYSDGFDFSTAEGSEISIRQTLGMSLFSLKSSKQFDRYTIEFGTSLLKQTRTYDVTADHDIKIIKSRYKGHLIIGKNWMDFENDDKDSTVSVKRVNKRKVTVTVYSNNFNFNSIGGLNVVNVFYNFQVDNDPPEFLNTSTINMTAPFQNDDVNITFACYDIIGISTCIIGHNNSGTWSNVTNTTVDDDVSNLINFSYILDVTAANGQTVGAMACANDTFNNWSCSNVLTLQVNDTSIPTIITFNNATRFLGNQSINFTFNVTDNLELSFGQVITNETGSIRYFNFSLSGTVANFSQNITISAPAGSVINVTGRVNDTFNNFNQIMTQFLVTKDFFINATNIYGNTSIINFTAILSNDTDELIEHSTTGLLNFTDIISGNFHVNISSNESGGYLNRSYQNFNVRNDLNALLHQAEVTFTALRKGTNVSILDFNVSVPKLNNISNSSGGLLLFLNASNYNFTSRSEDYFDIDVEQSISAKSTNTFVALFSDINLSIEVYSIVNNSAVGNYTVYLTANGTDFTENVSVDEGNATFSLGNNTYSILIDSTAFAPITDTFFLGSNVTFINLSYSVMGINSINFTLFDEFTDLPLLQNASISVIGADQSFNLSTENGLLYIQDLNPGEYRITYDSQLFSKRDHFVTIINNTNNSIQLYLLSITNGTDVTFTVQDNSGNALEDATISLKKYFIGSNSYKVVAMARTNFEGEAAIDVDFNDAYYQTFTTFRGFSLNTVGTKIITTTFFITLNLLADPFQTVDAIQDITSSISFNNNTETFSYTFDVKSGTDRTATIEVFRITPAAKTLVCTQSTTSSSGTVLCQFNTSATEGTYVAEGSIVVSDRNILDKTIETWTGFRQGSREIFGDQGLFFSILILGTLAGLGAFVSPAIAIVLFLVGLGVVALLGFSGMQTGIYIAIAMIGFFIAYRMKS